MFTLSKLNKLGTADITFFIICISIVVVIIAIWLLIPVFNKQQYQERRESLRRREAAFRSNIQAIQAQKNAQSTQTPTEDNSVAVSNADVSENYEEVTK